MISLKDEIKEILDRMQELVKHKYDKEIHTYNFFDDIQGLLDCITNLQAIEQQYSAILSENAELENKITNLQEIEKEHQRINGELREENKRLREQLEAKD